MVSDFSFIFEFRNYQHVRSRPTSYSTKKQVESVFLLDGTKGSPGNKNSGNYLLCMESELMTDQLKCDKSRFLPKDEN